MNVVSAKRMEASTVDSGYSVADGRNMLALGIAYVSFPSGGLFLPARNPADRHRLIADVEIQAHTQGLVQVLVADRRWIVHDRMGPGAPTCSSCDQIADYGWYSSFGDDVYCGTCALRHSSATLPPDHCSSATTAPNGV